MDIGTIGGLLGSAGQFAGGLSKLLGGGGDSGQLAASTQNALDDRNWQREVFYNRIRATVADAKLAGVHPIYALGGGGFQPSPTQILSDMGSGGADYGGAFRDMGQGLSRAVAATQSKAEQQDQHVKDMILAKQMEKIDADIAYTRAQTEAVLRRGTGSPPGAVGLNTVMPGMFEQKPAEVTSSQPDRRSMEAGPGKPVSQIMRMPGGVVETLPTKDVNLEERESPGWLSYMITNRVLPMLARAFPQGLGRFHEDAKPPDRELPPGANDWKRTLYGWEPVFPTVDGRDYIHRAPRQHYGRGGYN